MNVVLSLFQMKWLVLFILIGATGCAVSNTPERETVRLLLKGKLRDDTSYVYSLPYEPGKKHWIVQGYYGIFSHRDRAALDFVMPRGSKITAARDGVVTRVKEDGVKGGWNKKYRKEGNNVVIQHADGSRAGYWHLQHNGALVNLGDSVKKGQVIALSGKTGFTNTPHLHFIVWKSSKENWEQIPTRFQTSKGIKYLRAWRSYKSVNSQ